MSRKTLKATLFLAAALTSLTLNAAFSGEPDMSGKSVTPAKTYWDAPDKAEKVFSLRPGAGVPNLTPEALFRDWTKDIYERWHKDNPDRTISEVCEEAAKGNAEFPSDSEIENNFPDHISPYGLLHSGVCNDSRKEEKILAGGSGSVRSAYCPFCGSFDMRIVFDKKDSNHAWTRCCKHDLYERDYPEGYDLVPSITVDFPHLDGTVKKVPAALYTDSDGLVWELFIPTIFACKRWDDYSSRCVTYMKKFKKTGDPAYAYKIAAILDKTADAYYGLPPAAGNKIAKGRDGKALTRKEWEAIPRPNVFGYSYIGTWNRRQPLMNTGWLRLCNEAKWAEPFARVRHHPAFKYYSQKKFGDAEALDLKVRKKLMREICLTWESVSHLGLLTGYQDAIYVSEMLAAVLGESKDFLNFTAPSNELTLYNHHHQDGLCNEGAANYMRMPGGCYYPVLSDPDGLWLELYPTFLEERPFFKTASTEFKKLRTVRGLELEFGDEHIYAFKKNAFISDSKKVAEREKTPSRNWPGWGIGILRFGGAGHRQEMTLSYTRIAQHGASDQLGISCWIDGVPVMRPGGYSGSGFTVPIQFERPEIRALNNIGYPHEIIDASNPFGWEWGHSPLMQNMVTVDETFTSIGWQDNRGFGELVTYKGGEEADDPGADFQILEARDRYSFDRVGVPVREYRRAIIGITGSQGRPYAVDVTTLTGGKRHALYNSAWAERDGDSLPEVKEKIDSLLPVMKSEGGVEVLGHLSFPREWKYFGPVRNSAPEIDATAIKEIPEELSIGDSKYEANFTSLNLRDELHFDTIVREGKNGKTVYLMSTITVNEEMRATLGAGMDRAMKWWVNGTVVCDTLKKGNRYHPPAINDHIFNVDLKKGDNLVVVKVVVGSGKQFLVTGGPKQLNTRPVVHNRKDHIALERVRACEILKETTNKDKAWSMTWKTDYAAYAPRDPKTGEFKRPVGEDVGKVNLRFFGLPQKGQGERLIRAKGPWIARITQPLMNGGKLDNNVGFQDAIDMLIETNEAKSSTASSHFVHVIEGFRQDEESMIKEVNRLPLKSGNPERSTALEIKRTDGTKDIVIYQADAGKIELAGGLSTDARYAFVRFGKDGKALRAEGVAGSYLKLDNIFDIQGTATFTGTIVDMVGDITGTRKESAFFVKPDQEWPDDIPSGCHQMIVEGENSLRCDFREAYSVDKIGKLDNGNLRIDLSFTPPLTCGWHQVMELDKNKPGFFKTNRPIQQGSETTWNAGMTVWFPRINKRFIFEDLTGGFHQCTEGILAGKPDLEAEGVKLGDWFVIYYLKPGMKVRLNNVLSWNITD